ncbi:MAG: cupin domain-containing protein [Pelagimonas sp.]|uniref:cupin domain-containing protein n=1 Tax=Pelagimonas sp. TaxID=2073170 RepID=UPI003D6B99DF
MTRLPLLTATSLALLVPIAPKANPAPNITLIPASALDWAQTPEGVGFAPLRGDRTTEPYFAMVRLPAGLKSPAHTKSAAMVGLMVSGEMTHVIAGTNPADAPRIGPGGYYEIPANLPHVSSCVSQSPCVTLLYQDGAFDFLPVDAAAVTQ